MSKTLPNMNLRECRYVIGGKGADGLALYCAKTTETGSEYCACHYKMIYQDTNLHRRHMRALAQAPALTRI